MGWLDKRIFVVCGHYGSGKTEFSVNFSQFMALRRSKVTVVDLDVINPYFRSREKKAALESKGIQVVSSFFDYSDSELPAVSAQVYGVLADETVTGIIDLGGDPDGTLALRRFLDKLPLEQTEVLFVLNANRPGTSTLEAAEQSMKEIQAALGLKITGIINNTHLLYETSRADICRGLTLAQALEKRTGVPLRLTTVNEILEKSSELNHFPKLIIHRQMTRPWEELC